MKSYPLDLRQRVIQAYENGEESQRALVRRFNMAPTTLQNWIRSSSPQAWADRSKLELANYLPTQHKYIHVPQSPTKSSRWVVFSQCNGESYEVTTAASPTLYILHMMSHEDYAYDSTNAAR